MQLRAPPLSVCAVKLLAGFRSSVVFLRCFVALCEQRRSNVPGSSLVDCWLCVSVHGTVSLRRSETRVELIGGVETLDAVTVGCFIQPLNRDNRCRREDACQQNERPQSTTATKTTTTSLMMQAQSTVFLVCPSGCIS